MGGGGGEPKKVKKGKKKGREGGPGWVCQFPPCVSRIFLIFRFKTWTSIGFETIKGAERSKRLAVLGDDRMGALFDLSSQSISFSSRNTQSDPSFLALFSMGFFCCCCWFSC